MGALARLEDVKPPPHVRRVRGPIPQELIDEICEALEMSVPFKYACEGAGIAESTGHLWMDKGARGEVPYDAFHGAVTRARARAVKNLTGWALAGGKGSAAATFFLERRYRKHYAPIRVQDTSTSEVLQADNDQRPLSELSDEELERIASGGGA